MPRVRLRQSSPSTQTVADIVAEEAQFPLDADEFLAVRGEDRGVLGEDFPLLVETLVDGRGELLETARQLNELAREDPRPQRLEPLGMLVKDADEVLYGVDRGCRHCLTPQAL